MRASFKNMEIISNKYLFEKSGDFFFDKRFIFLADSALTSENDTSHYKIFQAKKA